MTSEYIKILNIVQLISEITVFTFYVLSIFPGFYYGVFWIVIPLVILNFALAIVKKDNTISFTTINLIMSVIAFVPLLGWFALFIGIFMSLFSAQIVSKNLGVYNSEEYVKSNTSEYNNDETESKEEAQTVKVVKKSKSQTSKNKTAKKDNPV